MAVGNPYGRGPYGKGPYARYGTGRPYGRGPYGTGPYGRWGGNTFDVAGHALLAFGLHASAALTYQPGAASSILWSAWAEAPNLSMLPWAISEIVFQVQAELVFTWATYAPCEAGTWQPADPCEAGAWAPPAGCSPGSWAVARLV